MREAQPVPDFVLRPDLPGSLDGGLMHKTACVLAIALWAVGCDKGHVDFMDSGLDSGPSDSGSPDAGCTPAGAAGCFFESGQEVWVDGFAGVDDAGACCCGTTDVPCQSLTHVMAIIGAGRTTGVVVHAYLSDGRGDWPVQESWPVSLYLGVKVEAPDIFFNYPQGGDTSTAFTIYQWDPEDTSQVVLEGAEQADGGYLHIGIPIDGGPWGPITTVAPNFANAVLNGWGINLQRDDGGPILRALPLQLSHLWLNGNLAAIALGTGGALTVGPLPVHVGSWQQQANVGGNYGILCSSDPGQPSTIADVGPNVLQIDGQTSAVVFKQGCIATLLHSPSIGFQPDGGAAGCPISIDGTGVTVQLGEVTFGSLVEPATIQCQGINGLKLGGGFLSFVGDIINSNCAGAEVDDGLLNIEGTHFVRNFIGVWANGTGMAYIDGASTGPTTFQCTASNEGGSYPPIHRCFDQVANLPTAPSGVAVANTTTSSSLYLNAIGWPHWDIDAGQPQVWRCIDRTYGSCTCTGPLCPDGGAQPLPDEADFVYLSTNSAELPYQGFIQGGSLAPSMTCE